MKQTLKLDFELPNFNEIIADSKSINKRSGWSKYSDKKSRYTMLIGALAKSHLRPILGKDLPVDINIKWCCKDKRKNKDGISAGIKFILDGLVAAGILRNDGWGEINNIHHYFMVDKDNPHIEIILTS